MPTQPVVPFWFAITVVVLSAMITAALAFSDPAVAFITLCRLSRKGKAEVWLPPAGEPIPSGVLPGGARGAGGA